MAASKAQTRRWAAKAIPTLMSPSQSVIDRQRAAQHDHGPEIANQVALSDQNIHNPLAVKLTCGAKLPPIVDGRSKAVEPVSIRSSP